MRNGNPTRVLVVLACLVVTAVLLLLPVEVSCDASGCSRVENAAPSHYGCLPTAGSACYECYYSSGGGTSTCFEDGPGGVKYCIDNQY